MRWALLSRENSGIDGHKHEERAAGNERTQGGAIRVAIPLFEYASVLLLSHGARDGVWSSDSCDGALAGCLLSRNFLRWGGVGRAACGRQERKDDGPGCRFQDRVRRRTFFCVFHESLSSFCLFYTSSILSRFLNSLQERNMCATPLFLRDEAQKNTEPKGSVFLRVRGVGDR